VSDCDCELEVTDHEQRSVLWALLAINGVMFLVELTAGWLAQSTGLIADSLDMLADAAVYGISLYAVGRAASTKTRAAFLSGLFQIVLALTVLADVLRRFFVGSDPVSIMMMSIGVVALAANVTCLALIAKHRHGEVHMRASWIFSVNDVLANLGVIVAGGLVLLMDSRLPDLVIGFLISMLVLRGGVRILREARAS
jgi:cation diffusion facilitator family transporter